MMHGQENTVLNHIYFPVVYHILKATGIKEQPQLRQTYKMNYVISY